MASSNITYTVFGDEITTTDSFKKLTQGVGTGSNVVVYTVPAATQTIIKAIALANSAGTPALFLIYVDGSAATNLMYSVSVPANGSATYDGQWRVYDLNGIVLSTAAAIAATGDATGTQSGSTLPLTLATVNGAPGTFGSATTVSQVTVNAKGLATTVAGVAIQIAESQVTNLVTDLAGKQPTGNYITALTGDGTATGPGSVAFTLATVNANVGSFGSATQVMTQTVNAKGLTTAAASVSIQIAESQVTNLVTDLAGKQPTGNYITALTGDGVATGPGSVAFTLATVNSNVGTFGDSNHVGAITVNAKGLVTAVTSATIQPMQGWIDVTLATLPVLTTNTAAQNVTAINAIMAAAPGGSTIYFPGGTYNFNAAWTMPAKQFTFQGQGGGLAGGYTLLAWTSVVGGDFITLVNLIWYTQFRDLTFISAGVAQTAGAVVNINGNAFTGFQNCTFGGTGGGTLFDLLRGPANLASLPISDNSWNQSIISNCVGTSYKGTAIHVNARGSSLVVENSTFNGQWGTTSQIATAGVEGRWVGALQVSSCDFIGHVNNVLLDPVTANAEVCASVQVSNTYFDFSLGSCIKISGTGATVRCKWDTCTFTTSNASTGFSAVELAGSFVYPAGGQDIAFVNCNIYNTFATTGTTNGILITNAADVSFVNCKVAGWTNGYNITPMASNKTNVQIIGGTCGASGGFGGNTTGFNIVGGAYKGLLIRANNARGNTTALTLGAVTVLAGEGDLFAISENSGINPKMGAALTPPVAVPVSTTVYTNLTGFTAQIFFKATTAISAMSINGVATVFVATTQTGWVTVLPGGTFAYTATGTLSWVWVGQ